MVDMIDIIVDGNIFSFGISTLKKHPNFIITQLINEKSTNNDLVQKVDNTTFKIDMSVEQFSLIAKELRDENNPNYLNEMRIKLGIVNNTDSKYQKEQKGGVNANSGIFRKQTSDENRYVDIGSSIQPNTQPNTQSNRIDFLKYFTDSSIGPNIGLTELETGKDLTELPDILGQNKHTDQTNLAKTLNMINTNTLTETENGDIYHHNNVRVVKNNQSSGINTTIPKGHHIFRSRKIELDTSKDK